jgi:hypothetical protein
LWSHLRIPFFAHTLAARVLFTLTLTFARSTFAQAEKSNTAASVTPSAVIPRSLAQTSALAESCGS